MAKINTRQFPTSSTYALLPLEKGTTKQQSVTASNFEKFTVDVVLHSAADENIGITGILEVPDVGYMWRNVSEGDFRK